jgi:hypothetical protein
LPPILPAQFCASRRRLQRGGDAAAQVLTLAGELSEQAERLRREVETFLATVRAA